MTISPEQATTAKVAVDFLNGLLEVDRDAVSALIRARVPCNDALAGHPTVQVGLGEADGAGFEVGLLGLLNGMIGADGSSQGYLVARFDDQALLDFQLRPIPSEPPPAGESTGVPLPYYDRGEESWPAAWVLPDLDDDEADLFGKMAYLTDDIILREAVHIWDNVMRIPEAFGGIAGGLISAHARLVVGSGGCVEDLEKAAEAVGEMWLGMAQQAAALGVDGEVH